MGGDVREGVAGGFFLRFEGEFQGVVQKAIGVGGEEVGVFRSSGNFFVSAGFIWIHRKEGGACFVVGERRSRPVW